MNTPTDRGHHPDSAIGSSPQDMGLLTTRKQPISTYRAKMQYQIIIPHLTKENYPGWIAAIRLQACAPGLCQTLDDTNFTTDLLLERTIASLTNDILESIPAEAQSEEIHGNPQLQLHSLLIHITAPFSRTSPATMSHES